MDERERWIAEEFRLAVNEWSNSTERSEQSKQFRVGPSDLGYCSERLRRMLDRQVPEDEVDWNKAFIGTWLGEGLEQAIQKRWPHAKTQVTIGDIALETDTNIFVIEGHADLLDPRGLLIDVKAKDGLEWIRRQKTPDQGYQFQRHLYAWGAHRSGLFNDDVALEDVLVGNAYYDRSGREATPHVQIEPFSMSVIEDASRWLGDVVYAFLNKEEAMKEPAREVCEKTCGYFTKCRAYDTDVEGLITDAKQLGAVDMYADGSDLISQGRRLQNEAKLILRGVDGHTPEKTVRWIQINGGERGYVQEPYMRLQITKRKK